MNFSKGNYFPGTLYSPALKCVGNCLCPSLSVMWALEAEERGLLWPSLLPVKYGYSLPRNIGLDAIVRAHSAPKKITFKGAITVYYDCNSVSSFLRPLMFLRASGS